MNITIASINATIAARGIAAELVKGEGYYYFMGAAVEGAETTMVMVTRLRALTEKEWMGELDAFIADAEERRAPVIPAPLLNLDVRAATQCSVEASAAVVHEPTPIPADAPELFWTLNDGRVVDRKYVRLRANTILSDYRAMYTLEQRRQAVHETIDNDEWMRARNRMLASAVIRDVFARVREIASEQIPLIGAAA